MNRFVTSDLHFFHKNIIQIANRPFENLDDMHEKLINNWNSVVEDNDEVYILGDFSFGKVLETEELLRKLNGKKFLIKGNHDELVNKKHFNINLFEGIYDYFEMNYEGQFYTMSHYPFLEWNAKRRGTIHLHGHTHQDSIITSPNCMCVCVEANSYIPIKLSYFKTLKSK